MRPFSCVQIFSGYKKNLVITQTVLYNKEKHTFSTNFYEKDVDNMAKHTIRILNYNLTLTSDDDKSYIDNVAQRVERNIKTLSEHMPTRNMTEVSLFVAMDYCDRYMKAIGDGSAMRSQIKDYLRDTNSIRQQLEEAKKENELLKAELAKLRERPEPPVNPVVLNDDDDDEEEEEEEQNQSQAEEETSVSAIAEDFVNQNLDKIAPAEQSDKQKKQQPFAKDQFSRNNKKNNSKNKKKGNKDFQPIKGTFADDEFSESADTVSDIMSFFEDKSFNADDD